MHIQSSPSLSVGLSGSDRTGVMYQFSRILYRQRHRKRLPQRSNFRIGKHLIEFLYPHVHELLNEKPIPLLWRLRVTLRQQIVLTSIFTLAGL